jgi:hypothetical protein
MTKIIFAILILLALVVQAFPDDESACASKKNQHPKYPWESSNRSIYRDTSHVFDFLTPSQSPP